MAFGGSKIALYLGDRLVVILRDDHEGLPFASCWGLMADAGCIALERAVPEFQHHLRLCLLREGGEVKNPPQRSGGR